MQIEHFEDLPLSQEIMNGIEKLGFNNLFPIQAQAIIPLLKGKDVIGQARTGTGKTAAFGIPMVESLNPNNSNVQGLILVPTRELANQVADHLSRISRYTPFRILPVYGGTSIQRQISELERGVHIVVGTPGRLIDLMKRGWLNFKSVKVVVLDEADRMLDMGFIDDIEYILARVPKNRQTSLFSATIDRSVMNVCNRYMNKPEKILVSKDEIALTQIEQYYMVVNPKRKLHILCNILDENNVKRAIIFCKTRIGTSRLANQLRRRGYNAEPIHGGLSQARRDYVTAIFRKGSLKLLVATDVAARGLDIQGITHIINYDIPLDALVYFHRIGRTARMGGEGTAITLVGFREMEELNRIRALTNTKIEEIEGRAFPDTEAFHESFSAICSDCGSECTVPFKPDKDRPIYCKQCWEYQKPPIERLY
ncbi:MAG: DEAD/DEAH box helicase [Candidatus Bathyarchaeota archaeon]